MHFVVASLLLALAAALADSRERSTTKKQHSRNLVELTAAVAAAEVDRTHCMGQFEGGRWVRDSTITIPYTRPTKPDKEKERRSLCSSQDDRSWEWRWESGKGQGDLCELVRPSSEQLCAALAGKRLLLIGDSLTMQHIISIVKLLGAGDVPDALTRGAEGCATLSCSVTNAATRQRSTLTTELCRLYATKMVVGPYTQAPLPGGCAFPPPRRRGGGGGGGDGGGFGGGSKFWQLVTPAQLRAHADAADLVIINEFAWWAGAVPALRNCLLPHVANADEAIDLAFTAVLNLYRNQTWAKAEALQDTATPVFYRTAAPGRPLKVKADGPMPVDQVDAQLFSYGHQYYRIFNEIARDAFTGSGLDMMELEGLMVPRIDGHPARDPVHYCLPGPPDALTHALYSWILPRDANGDPV